MKSRLEVDVDVAAREETLDIRIVQRLDADRIGTGIESGNLEITFLAKREAADQGSGAEVERDDVCAQHRAAAAANAPAHGAGACTKVPVGIQVGDAGNVVRLQLAIVCRSAAQRDR